MQEFRNQRNLYIENDKRNAPFLLAASFRHLIEFHGSHLENGVLYWLFTPKDKARILLERFNTKTEPHIAAKDLFEAIETWWRQVSKARNGGIQYEKSTI